MSNSKKSVVISICVCFIVSAVLLILVVAGPMLFEIYLTTYRGFLPDGEALATLKTVFGFCFYPSSVFAAIILYSLLKLLYNIKDEKIFITKNVRYLKTVSWSCFAIAVITLAGGFFYMPMLMVAAAGGFTGVLLRALKNVMQSAVELREENDLTI